MKCGVQKFDLKLKRVKGYFFVKHVHWERNHLWVRESSSRTMDRSVIDILPGIWHGPNWQEQI